MGSSPPPTPSTSTHVAGFHNSDCRQVADHRALEALLDPPHRNTGLRRLSWTNYDYENGDYEDGSRYYLRVLGPEIERAQDWLEFLETLSKSSAGGSFFDTFPSAPPTINPHRMTTLKTLLSSTTIITPTSPPPPLSHNPSTSTSTLGLLAAAPLQLPALRSLKVTLANVTFAVLASRDMAGDSAGEARGGVCG